MSQISVKKSGNTVKAAIATVPVLEVTTSQKQNKQQPKQNKNKNKNIQKAKSRGSIGNVLVQNYVKTLNDPFEYGAVRLGFDTMVPTNLATGYVRQIINTNADGSFALFVIPGTGNGVSGARGGLYTNISGLNGTTWTSASFVNSGTIRNMGKEARLISCGLRVLPLVANTAAPGILYCNSVGAETYATMAAQSPQSIANDPLTRWANGRDSVTINSRPVDYDSYSYFISILSGYADNVVPYSSIPVISGVGFPAATAIQIDAIVNLEIVAGIFTSFANYAGSENVPNDPTVSDYIPSVDALWASIKNVIGNPVIVDSALAGVGGYMTGGKSGAVGSVFNTMTGKKMFNPPKHVTVPLFTGTGYKIHDEL